MEAKKTKREPKRPMPMPHKAGSKSGKKYGCGGRIKK